VKWSGPLESTLLLSFSQQFFPFLFIWYQINWFRWHFIYLFPFLFHAARDAEILKLKQLLDEKAEKNNSAATGFPCLAPEAVLENSTPLSPKRKTPFSHGKVKRVQLSEDVHHSSPAEEKSE
jgi:hypothetical protein